MSESIAQRIRSIKNDIAALEKQYQRQPGAVSLLAVSKKKSVDNIRDAFEAGQRDFGENYLQEALTKIEQLAAYDITWHFIGHIQSNKTGDIANHFAWVHSVDRLKVAKRLHEQRLPSHPPLNICIQVNIDNEAEKSGVNAKEVLTLAIEIAKLDRLVLRGLMLIPKAQASFDEQQAAFKKAAHLQTQLKEAGFAVDTLSMGMSNDFAAAIAQGSTMIRLGTAIFGKR